MVLIFPSLPVPTATSASPRALTIPTSPLIDCGQPLDNKEQYFDLYPPETGSNSIATGSALVVPLSATRVTFAVNDGNASVHPTAWEIRTGSCTGPVVESGTIGADGAATQIVYAALNTSTWQLVITHSNNATTCYPVT